MTADSGQQSKHFTCDFGFDLVSNLHNVILVKACRLDSGTYLLLICLILPLTTVHKIGSTCRKSNSRYSKTFPRSNPIKT